MTAWLPMETAPKDGSMLRLLVAFEDHATDDSAEPSPTIGFNNLGNTGEDGWQFAGWSWQQDCFTDGVGEPIGWLPLLPDPEPVAKQPNSVARELVAEIKALMREKPTALNGYRLKLWDILEAKIVAALTASSNCEPVTKTEQEVIGYATHHDDPMLFPTIDEARLYCGWGEEPIPLIKQP